MAEKDVVHLVSYRGAAIRRIMAVFMPLSSGSLTALHAREGLHRRNAKSYLGLFVNICFTLRKGCRYPSDMTTTVPQSTHIAQ